MADEREWLRTVFADAQGDHVSWTPPARPSDPSVTDHADSVGVTPGQASWAPAGASSPDSLLELFGHYDHVSREAPADSDDAPSARSTTEDEMCSIDDASPTEKFSAGDYDDPGPLWRNGTGGALGTTYDATRRWQYDRKIGAVARSSLDGIRQTRLQGRSPANAAVWARAASWARNDIRQTAQGSLTPAGTAYSRAIEKNRSWPEILEKYSKEVEKMRAAGEQVDDFTLWRRIAGGAGKSNPLVSALGKGTRLLGPISAGIGLARSVERYRHATPEQKGRVVAEESGSVAGGYAGSQLGSLGGIAAMTLLGITNPWLLLGGMALGGFGGGVIGGELGRTTFGSTYESLRNPSESRRRASESQLEDGALPWF